MATMTKKELVDRMAESTKTKPSTVKAVVQGFLNEITSELAKGNRLEFREFGVFEVRKQAAREAHDPQTLEPIDVPAKRVVRFKMGRLMRETLSSDLSHTYAKSRPSWAKIGVAKLRRLLQMFTAETPRSAIFLS